MATKNSKPADIRAILEFSQLEVEKELGGRLVRLAEGAITAVIQHRSSACIMSRATTRSPRNCGALKIANAGRPGNPSIRSAPCAQPKPGQAMTLRASLHRTFSYARAFHFH